MTWLAHFAALLSAAAGFVCLAAVMERHAEDLLGRMPTRRDRVAWRSAGALLLAIALALCIEVEGTSIGIAAWFGLMTLAAMLVGLGFTRGAAAGTTARRAR